MNAVTESFDFNIMGESYALPRIATESQTKENILLNATVLFAMKGYAAVSMRELADTIGIKPASLYNHFNSKEVLWQEVLDHAKELYLLYFRQLNQALAGAKTFEDALDTIFMGPKRMANVFTCYAFSMIHAEQFRDKVAGELFTTVFLEYSITFLQDWFEKYIAQGLVQRFDTGTVARLIMHSVLIGLNAKVQECVGRKAPYDFKTVYTDLQCFIINAVKKDS